MSFTGSNKIVLWWLKKTARQARSDASAESPCIASGRSIGQKVETARLQELPCLWPRWLLIGSGAAFERSDPRYLEDARCVGGDRYHATSPVISSLFKRKLPDAIFSECHSLRHVSEQGVPSSLYTSSTASPCLRISQAVVSR